MSHIGAVGSLSGRKSLAISTTDRGNIKVVITLYKQHQENETIEMLVSPSTAGYLSKLFGLAEDAIKNGQFGQKERRST